MARSLSVSVPISSATYRIGEWVFAVVVGECLGRKLGAHSGCRSQRSITVLQTCHSSGLSGHNVVHWTDSCLRFTFSVPRSIPAFPTPLRRALVIIGPGIGLPGPMAFLGALKAGALQTTR
jgi:hypothetical protein